MKFGTLIRIKDASESAKAFAELKKAGLESCQLVYKPEKYEVKDADAIKNAAAENGIEISAFFAGYRDDHTVWDLKDDFKNAGLNSKAFGAKRLKYLLGALPFIRSLGTSDMIIHAGFVPNNPFAPEYADLVRKVKTLATQAKNFGLNVLFETGGESPITLLRLIKEVGTGNLFVNLDTGNLIMYGYGNPCEAVMTLGKYIRNVHAKDGVPPTDPYKIGEEKPLGKGVVDFKRVFSLLKEIGYDRFVTIEREIVGEEQKRDILLGLDYLKNISKQI